MSNADLKECVIVKGFRDETNFNAIKYIFPESSRGALLKRSDDVQPNQKEWIIQFPSTNDAQKYIEERVKKSAEGILQISACESSTDIPDEWLQGNLPEEGQPPPYSMIYSNMDPSALTPKGSYSDLGYPQHYDPNIGPHFMHQAGPYRHPHYQHAGFGMQWGPYPDPSGQNPGQGQEKGPYGTQQPYWGWNYPGYRPQFQPYGQGYPFGYPGHPGQPQQDAGHQPPTSQPGPETELSSEAGARLSEETPSKTAKLEVEESSDEEVVQDVKSEEEPAKKTTNMLKVTKLPPGTTTDSLTFFFENTRKSGGGDVADVEYDEDTASAIITFEEDEAVDIVLQKMPIKYNGKLIEVEAHTVNTGEPDDIPDVSNQHFIGGEDETTCTIEVRGMKPSTTQDTLEFYFESRRGANVDVEKIEFIEDKDMYLITFQEEEGVEKVLQKNHTVDGAKLQVKKHVPPKRYPNKALIKGFSTKTTKDGIINFLEARTKQDVEEVDFGDEDSGRAIVTFAESIDLDKIQTACKKKQLDGNYLSVHPVVVTNCIVVRGYSDKTTDSSLEYYFDNKRKSGVEGVTEVRKNDDEDYCVIYFEEAEDALKACQRTHKLDNCTLKVQVFYDCLGIPADEEGPKFKPLPPLIVTDIDKKKIEFLQNAQKNKEALEKQLENVFAKILWPSAKGDHKLKIECTLTKDTKDCRKLAKTWEENARKQLDAYMDILLTEKHNTMQEAWGPVMEKIRDINVTNPDSLCVSVEKPPVCDIYISGHKIPVQELSMKIKGLIRGVVADLEKKKQQVQEENPLKHHQLLLLALTDFPEKMKQRYEGMDVTIDTRKLVITFIGLFVDVTAAKVNMFETLQNIVGAPVGKRSQSFIKFLKKPEVKSFVGKQIKNKGLVGVWDIQGETITMYSMSDDGAVDAADIFKESVVETKVDVDNLQKSILRSSKWSQHVQSIEDEYQQKNIITQIVTDKQDQIYLYCTSRGEAGMIREKIQDFFLLNTEKETTIDLPPAQLKFLQEHMMGEVDQLVSDMKQRNVIIAVKSDCILIKGNAQGMKDAEDQIDALTQKIHKTTHSMDKPGLHELVQSSQGKSKLKQVGKQAGVIISSDSDEDNRSSGRGVRARALIGANEKAVFTAAGGQQVVVVKGDITELDVDVIVNAANKDLAHSGGLAKVIVNKGGKSIQDECNKYTSYKGQLAEGEVYCSGPGNLKCKMIVHAVGPVWQGGSNKEEDCLSECVEMALVETDKNKFLSIAIPALCTGIFGYPVPQATKAIAQSVRDYFKRSQSSNIQIVYLCDVKDDTVDSFEKAGNKCFGQRDSGSYNRTPARTQGNTHLGGHSVTAGNIQIKIVKGELAKMRVDVIANTASTDLDLSKGAVSASLLKYGGQGLQQECKQKHPNGVKYGEVAVTSGGKLQCQIVCHGALESWRKDASPMKALEEFVTGCLAVADNKGCKSIAFPAMGTGQLGYPKDLVARHMYSSVDQFSLQNPSSSVTEVLFVLYIKDYQTIQAFEDEEKHRQGSHGRHDRQSTETHTSHQGRGKSGKKKGQQQQKPQGQGTSDTDKEYSVSMGNVTFKVYQGDITAVKVDAIVNGTNTDLDLSLGAVSKAIKTKGGQELDKQLNDQRKVMKKEGIAVTKTKSSGLPCDNVIHIDMSGVNPTGFVGAISSAFSYKIKDRIKQALEKAEEIKAASVAFPALGTSTTTSIPVSETAEEMFKVVEKFNSGKPKHMQEVHVVIYQKDMMKDFMDAIQNCVNKSGKDKGYVGKLIGWVKGDKPLKVSRHDRQLVREAQAPANRHMATMVTFFIYAKDKGSAQNAIKLLEKAIESEMIERSVTARIIKEFTNEQVQEVKKLAETGKVEVKVDTNKGEIILRGFMHNVSDAVDKANSIVSTAEHSKQSGQKAKLVTDMVQWQYMEDDEKGNTKLVDYPADVNLLLESALKDQKKELSFCDVHGNRYVVDFNSYEEYRVDDKNDKVKVLRKSKLIDHAFELPVEWDKMDEKENLKIIELKTTDKEYQDVTKKFLATCGGGNITFVKVERIQNKTLYQQYVAKKKSMDATNPPGTKNEQQLWHGFSVDALDSINKYGFNRSYCGKNATAFGAGVYFAVNVSYSIQDTYSRPDPSGHKRMYLCRVLTGEYTVGAGDMRVPPAKNSAAGSHILFDSVTNNMSNPIMFVIFHDSQAFPEYLITFKR